MPASRRDHKWLCEAAQDMSDELYQMHLGGQPPLKNRHVRFGLWGCSGEGFPVGMRLLRQAGGTKKFLFRLTRRLSEIPTPFG